MTALKSLTLTTLPKHGNNPILNRRSNTIVRLEEQKLLLADPAYIRTTQRWMKKDGTKVIVDRKQRVLPWWRLDQTGAYLFFIKSSGRPIEFDKGKTAIAVTALDKLPTVIDTLITAVRNGELDEQMAQASKQRAIPKPPKAS